MPKTLRVSIDVTLWPIDPLPPAQPGVPYSEQIVVNGGVAPYTFVAPSPLPDGWAVSSSGVLSNTDPQAALVGGVVDITDSSA